MIRHPNRVVPELLGSVRERDRGVEIRRTPVTTTAPSFHSRCRNVLTVAVATSGTDATASRNSTTMA